MATTVLAYMTGALTTDAGLTASGIAVTNAGGTVINSGGTITVDAANNLDFSAHTITGSINGRAPGLTGPDEQRYGSMDFVASRGTLEVDVFAADSNHLATWDGGGGEWSEASPDWTLDGGSPSRYFKNGDDVLV